MLQHLEKQVEVSKYLWVSIVVLGAYVCLTLADTQTPMVIEVPFVGTQSVQCCSTLLPLWRF